MCRIDDVGGCVSNCMIASMSNIDEFESHCKLSDSACINELTLGLNVVFDVQG